MPYLSHLNALYKIPEGLTFNRVSPFLLLNQLDSLYQFCYYSTETTMGDI